MKKTVVILPFVLGLALAACENRNAQPLNPSHGNAVNHNVSLHVINPEPYTGTEPPEMDGVRAVETYKNYKNAKTEAKGVATN
jgi:hypothetical protein